MLSLKLIYVKLNFVMLMLDALSRFCGLCFCCLAGRKNYTNPKKDYFKQIGFITELLGGGQFSIATNPKRG